MWSPTEDVITKDPIFVAVLISYQAEPAPFPRSFFLDASINMNPTTWWKAVEKCGMPHNFIELALQLVSSCFFSIHWEDFSCLGGIHSKIQNRLGDEKTAKLVFCQRILWALCDLSYWSIKWIDSIVCVWKMWKSFGYWIKDTSKLFLLLLN